MTEYANQQILNTSLIVSIEKKLCVANHKALIIRREMSQNSRTKRDKQVIIWNKCSQLKPV